MGRLDKIKRLAKFKLGQVVYSVAGKDKGEFYIVVGIDERNYRIFVANGRKRGVLNPKPKNPFHLQVIKWVDGELREKLLKGLCKDLDVREALRKYMEFKAGHKGRG